MRIAVTGAAGQLGTELCRQIGEDVIPLQRRDLDLADASAIRRVVSDLAADAVINCAGYSAVDLAENEPNQCAELNADAVQHLANACREAGSILLQVSTDYVFGSDLQRHSPYRETDPTGPLNVYGRTKLTGEVAAASCEQHFVVRTCGLYGVNEKQNNFVETLLRLSSQRDRLRIVDDQHCTPTNATHLAQAIRFLLTTDAYGTYHVVDDGATTWFDFANEIFRQCGITVPVERISSSQYAAPARRPHYSVLETSKYQSLGGPEMSPWQDALGEYLRLRRDVDGD